MERIPNAHDDPNFMVALSENDVISTLCHIWKPTADSFHFTLKNWSPLVSMTKRSLISVINRVYDPIGLISPILIKGKIFIQQLWSLKMSYDQVLSEDNPDDLTFIQIYSPLFPHLYPVKLYATKTRLLKSTASVMRLKRLLVRVYNCIL